MFRLVLLFCFLIFLPIAAASQTVQDGVTAYSQGNFSKAFRIWMPIAEAGDEIAQFNLGLLYFNGEGVPKDHHEAAKWYQLAALQGNDKAQSILGGMYLEGDGVQKDLFVATKWLQLAAEQFDKTAKVQLKKILDEHVDVIATKTLGGAGSSLSEEERIRLAAEHGDIYAANQMAYKYIDGDGVEKSETEAVKWYRVAANQGDPTAQYNLGMMYASDRGVPPKIKDELMSNLAEAYVWLYLAARQGHGAAADLVDALSNAPTQISPVQVDLAKSFAEKWKPTLTQEAP